MFFNQKTVADCEKTGFDAYLAAIYFACMPLSIVPLPGGGSLLKYLSYVIGGFLVAKLFIGKTKTSFNIIHLFLGIYILYSIGSMFILRDETSVINLRGTLQTALLFFMITMRIYNKKEVRLMMNAWIFAGLFVTAFMLSGSIVGTGGDSGRVTVSIGEGKEDPNQLCGYFILPVLCCIQRIIEKNKWLLFYIASAIAMVYVAFTTGSRGGLVAIFAAVLIYVFVANKGFWNKMKIVGVILIVAIIFYFVFIPFLPQSVLDRMNVQTVVEDKGSGRFDLWNIILTAVFKDPTAMFFGYGLDSTIRILSEGGADNTVAHNHWLQLWCDQGLVGMLIFLLMFIISFTRTFKRNILVALSILGMFILSMSLTMYAYYKPFWNILMMAAINYAPYLNRDEKENDKVGEQVEQ